MKQRDELDFWTNRKPMTCGNRHCLLYQSDALDPGRDRACSCFTYYPMEKAKFLRNVLKDWRRLRAIEAQSQP